MVFDTTSWGPESSAKLSIPKIIDSLNALKNDGIAVPKAHVHAAAELINIPAGGLTATNVQAVINELNAKIESSKDIVDSVSTPATESRDGLLTAPDKTKLNNLIYATEAETIAGTAINRIVNPGTLAKALSYCHIQSIPSRVWTINHGMNRNIAITVVDSAGTEVEGEISHVDLNTVVVTFAGGFSGKAHIS